MDGLPFFCRVEISLVFLIKSWPFSVLPVADDAADDVTRVLFTSIREDEVCVGFLFSKSLLG